MSYQSIDNMQNLLSETIFSHTKSPRKAAGRALGTMVEIISFYLIKTWGHEHRTAIEKPLPEYANQEIMHNVEFTFHPSKLITSVDTPQLDTISSTRIYKTANLPEKFRKLKTTRNLLKRGHMSHEAYLPYSGLDLAMVESAVL